MQKRYSFPAVLTIASLLLSPVAAGVSAQAAEFDPALILTDADVRNVRSMSYPDVVFFLRDKGGLLQVRDIDPVDGLTKDAAQLIMDAATRYTINPRYIMALLQKESSVVEEPAPSQERLIWAAGYALCDGCNKSDPLPMKYRGFAKQVDAGAGWMDWYLKNASSDPGFKKEGDVLTIDGTTLAVRSTATAALYSYTPHLHGNRLLWDVLTRWFGDGWSQGTGKQKYPDGTVMRNAATGEVGVMQVGRLRVVANPSVLASRFGAVPAVALPAATFASLKTVGHTRSITFPDLSLVRDEKGNIYLLTGDKKRRIASPQAFAKIGFNPEEVEEVRSEDLLDYLDGEVIDTASAAAIGSGTLLQDKKTGGVYFAEGGTKRPIWDKALLSLRYAGWAIVPTAPSALDALTTGAPVTLPDGALVKAPGDPSVFLISSGGQRRSFADEAAFFSVGYRWGDVVTVNPKVLALHPVGAPIVAIDDAAVTP